MREQLSFFHSAPAGLRVEWRPYRGGIRAEARGEGLVDAFRRRLHQRLNRSESDQNEKAPFDVLLTTTPPIAKLATFELPLKSRARKLTPRDWGDAIVAFGTIQDDSAAVHVEERLERLFTSLDL